MPPPNIVFILTDQQRYDTINALGFPYMETPNLDRLVNEGTAFTNCFITAPSCVPSRCSIFTGYYPHTNGVYKNGDSWTQTWVSRLADSGYRCVNVGKMHTVPFEAHAGFHERYIVENKDRFLEGRFYFDEWDKALRARGLVKQQRALYRKRDDYRRRMGSFTWDIDEDMHSDFFVGEMARWWLETYPIEQPFFLEIGYPGPHPPYDPVPRWLERFRGKKLPVPRLDADDLATQPAPLKDLRNHMIEVDHDSVVHLQNPTQEQLLYQRQCYCANVGMIDESIGKIIDALDANGMLANTAIIFASDHGDCLNDHGHIQKWNMYEEVVHVPAILWAGSDLTGRAAAARADGTDGGNRVDNLCSLMDIGPTILELAGLTPDHDMEAISLLPLLRAANNQPVESTVPESGRPVAVGNSTWEMPEAGLAFVSGAGREYVFSEHGRDNILATTDVMTMIRNTRWKLVTFSGSDEGQLFDLESDPKEMVNLWQSSEHKSQKQKMLADLLKWHQNSAYRTRTRRRR